MGGGRWVIEKDDERLVTGDELWEKGDGRLDNAAAAALGSSILAGYCRPLSVGKIE